MKLELKTPPQPIPALLKLLPQPPSLEDGAVLLAIRDLLRVLREQLPAESPAYVFPQEVRAAFATALHEAVAEIISLKLPGTRSSEKTDGRRIDPTVAQARADKEQRIRNVQSFKRWTKELTDALTRCVQASKSVMEPEGSQPDNERRRRAMEPVVRKTVEAAQSLHAAATGGAASFDTDTKEIVEQAIPKFEAACEKWMNQTLPATKDFFPPKFNSTLNMLATLRSLTRDATETIRELKA